MTTVEKYVIGNSGVPWGAKEKAQWLELQNKKRCYVEEVLSKLDALPESLQVEQYGELTYTDKKFPLMVIKTKSWQSDKPTILVTGGVHGYETSGVQGAIRFASTMGEHYQRHFNILVAPCISPWGYETINRWNPNCDDPNRSFYQNSPSQEADAIMTFIQSYADEIVCHVDLHETTDTDNSEFRPALAARDAIEQKNWNIPDGFYLVGDTTKPQANFQKAVVDSVEKITHIAPSDDDNKLIGVPLEQWGVINYSARKLGLCMGLTEADFVTTTEVYPDSPKVDDENCILAQVAAVTGALDYLLSLK